MSDLLLSLRRVTRDLALIARGLEDLTAEVDRVGRAVEQLSDLARHRLGGAATPAEGRVKFEPRRAWDPRRVALLAEAERGAFALAMDWHPDGSAMIAVNHGEKFHLPPLLAALLAILTSKTGCESGALVGWKTRKEVQARLVAKAGWQRRPRALNQLVYRLRKELEARGVNPFLVQTRSKAGLRFALCLAAALDLERDGPPPR